VRCHAPAFSFRFDSHAFNPKRHPSFSGHRVVVDAYQLKRLVPSARVQTWGRDGAQFSMSPMGAIRVWQKQRLVASECVHDRQAHGAAPLNPEDYAYLEAFLLLEGRAWNDLQPVPARGA